MRADELHERLRPAERHVHPGSVRCEERVDDIVVRGPESCPLDGDHPRDRFLADRRDGGPRRVGGEVDAREHGRDGVRAWRLGRLHRASTLHRRPRAGDDAPPPARRPVALVGQSMGAHIAFLTAAARPDLVDRLVMLAG